MSIITLNNVSKAFNGMTLFESVNLSIEEGKIYGFIGPNGSGKSVLFKMICGFIFPDQGSIYVNHIEVGKSKYRFPENVGIIIDKPGYIPGKSGFENLKDLALIKNKINDNDIKRSMEIVGLQPESKQKVKNYSLGMKQKLALAQAIMENPKILILDEPFNALDEDSVITIRSLLQSFKDEGKTILLTSHNKEDIDILCDHAFRITSFNVELDRDITRIKKI